MTDTAHPGETGSPLAPFASATCIAAAVRSGEVSAAEVVAATLARIDALDGALNAFTVVLAEQALERARGLSAEELSAPLAGVPVAVKDHVWMAGAPATNGSRVLRDFVPPEDSGDIARLRAAGAVLVGKTNNPEFCYVGHTRSPVYGTTRNPFDLGRTPGGSSGGSAAAVSAGMVPLAVGTDGGGSIRAPSAFCAIVGHKPTFGIVPTRPGFECWPTLSVHGPMGRSVEDVALMLAVMAGPHSADPATTPVDTRALARAAGSRADVRGLRIFVSEDLGLLAPDPDVGDLFAEAVAVLEGLGCVLVDARLPSIDPVDLWYRIADAESYGSEGGFLTEADLLTDYSLEVLRRGEAMSAGDYLEAQELRRSLARGWDELYETVELVVHPSASVPPLPLEAAENGEDERTWGSDAVANLTGQPAISLPCGLTPQGLPVGIQLLGRRYEDAKVLAAAHVIAQALPRPLPPPPFCP